MGEPGQLSSQSDNSLDSRIPLPSPCLRTQRGGGRVRVGRVELFQEGWVGLLHRSLAPCIGYACAAKLSTRSQVSFAPLAYASEADLRSLEKMRSKPNVPLSCRSLRRRGGFMGITSLMACPLLGIHRPGAPCPVGFFRILLCLTK